MLGQEKNCLICKILFRPLLSNVKKGGGKYCSRKCYLKNFRPWNLGKAWPEDIRKKIGLAQIGKRTGKNNHFYGKKHTDISKEKISSANFGRIMPPFTVEHRKKIGDGHRGEKCNFWKGGIYPKNLAIRGSLEYKLWREAVFRRDNYKCVLCGDDRGGNLEADHIKSFSRFPEFRLEVSNGRTLCKICHKKTPNYGGISKRK